MEISLASLSDLTIKAVEETKAHKGKISSYQKPESRPRSALFHVKESVLTQGSNHFRTSLKGCWRRTEVITLEDESINGMEVLLGIFHDKPPDPGSISATDVWYTIQASHKYGFDPKDTKPTLWFDKWLSWATQNRGKEWKKDLKFISQLLFPCFYFDHAEGFQTITQRLVYNSPGRIGENNPVPSVAMHLPPILIRKSTLPAGLYKEISATLHGTIDDCTANGVCSYLKELQRIDVEPLGNTLFRNSVADILTRLDDFDRKNLIRNKHDPLMPCSWCSRSWTYLIESIQRRIRAYFDGLCLDCLRNHPDENSTYWDRELHREAYDGEWDSTCHISHGEPTWYFSFNRRRERNPYYESR